jgi:hypothetical protein
LLINHLDSKAAPESKLIHEIKQNLLKNIGKKEKIILTPTEISKYKATNTVFIVFN